MYNTLLSKYNNLSNKCDILNKENEKLKDDLINKENIIITNQNAENNNINEIKKLKKKTLKL